MRNTIYYKWFMDSLRKDQKEDYRQMSLNQQKDWYIAYLEMHYQFKKEVGHIKNEKTKEGFKEIETWHEATKDPVAWQKKQREERKID